MVTLGICDSVVMADLGGMGLMLENKNNALNHISFFPQSFSEIAHRLLTIINHH
jgi:hypothetical protein